MNKNRIAILILIVGITALVGYFIGKTLLGDNQLKPVMVEDARPITATVIPPDREIFRNGAINPTTPIIISQNNQNLIGN